MANENFDGQDFDSAPRFEGQDFDSLVAQHSATAPAPRSQSFEGQDFDSAPRFEGQDFDALVAQQRSGRRPKAEGPFASGVREAVHGIIPAAAGLVGMGAGAAAGTAAMPGVGTIAGGVAGGVAASMAADAAQEGILKAVGFDDSEQRAANREENKWSSFAGGMAPALVGMSPAAGASKLAPMANQLVQRGAGAGFGGAMEAGQDYLSEGHVDPAKVAAAAVAGAALPGVNRVGAKFVRAGERMVPGRPGRTANPAAAQAHVDVGDTAHNQEQARYADALSDPEAMRQFAHEEGLTESEAREVAQANYGLPQKQATIGNPQSAPTGSADRYPKGERSTPTENDMLTQGDMDPATLSALNQSLELNALQNEVPTAKIPGAAPQESLPIKTGIEEAAAANPKAADNVMSKLGGEKPTERPPVEAAEPPVETGIVEAAAGPKFEGQDFDSLVAAQRKPAPAAGKAAENSTGFSNLGNAGKDLGESLRDHLWQRAEAGEVSENSSSGPSAMLQGAKMARSRGGLKTRDEFVAYAEEQSKLTAGSPTFQDDMRALVEKHSPGESGRVIKGEPHPTPSDAQINANNFKKGRTRFAGREVAIETAEGGVRRSKADAPEPWEVKDFPYNYGDIKETIGADKDPVDIAIGKGTRHFIIDQRDANTGKFDEHKVFADWKSEADALTGYRRGFSDNRGRERMHHITEVTEKEAQDWLDNGDKTKPFKQEGRGTPGKPLDKPVPKVVTATVTELRARGMEDAAKAIEALPRERQVAEAARVNASLTNRTGAIPTEIKNPRIRAKPAVVEAAGVTANSKASAARKSGALEAADKVFKDHAPVEGETDAQLIERAQRAAEASKALDKYPFRMQKKPAAVSWIKAARELGPRPSAEKLQQFRADELLARNESADLVQGTNRIGADIAMSRHSGDDAIATAENENAAKGRFDIPHEEAESMVEPQPVKTAADLRELNDKTLDLTKPADAATAAIDTDKISRNIISQADKRLAREAREKTDTQLARAREAAGLMSRETKAPPTAPKSERFITLKDGTKVPASDEAKAGAARPIPLDDPGELDRILAAANKLQKKSKGLDALPAEKDPTAVPTKKEDLVSFAKFLNDQSGSLNHKKIASDFRARGRALKLSMEKYFGTPLGEVGRKVDAVLARAVSTEDSLMAEKAHELDARYYTWMKGSTPAEQLTYLKTIEMSKATDHAGLKADLEHAGLPAEKADWMANEALFHRELMDKLWLEDAKHGSSADYIERYVPHIFKDSKGAQDFIEARIKALGATWYQKERVFDLLDAALKQGFKMKFENPIDLIHARWAASIKSNMLVAAARGLHNDGLAFPVKDAPDFVKRNWQFKRLLPDHQQWVFAPGAETMWKNAMEPKGLGELEGPIGSTYRGWMKLKRIWAPIQLAFSAFHELHVAANINPAVNIARALKIAANDPKASGRAALDAIKWSLTDPILALPIDKIGFGLGKALDGPNGRFSQFAGRKAQHWWTTPIDQLDPTGRMWKRLFQEGGISPYQSIEDVIGAKRDFAKALNDKSWTAIPQGLRRGIEKIQEPMFKYQIPALKNVAFMRNVAAAMKTDPELATNHVKRGNVLREIGKDIDDRFGEMFYKSLFWNKYAKDAGIGSMLSLSWNLGQLRQVAGATKSVLGTGARLAGYKGKPMAEAKFQAGDKATFVGAYVGLSMASAGALSYMLTGELPTGLDYVFPKNGLKNADGSPQRLSTPFNTREPFMLKAHAEQHNSWVGGAMEFLWNKMVLSPLVEIAQNKDFFGNKLYDPNTAWYKKALQTMDSTAGRMFNPISLSGADRAEKLGGGAKEKALAYAGFNPAPKYVNATPMENHINHLFSEEGTPYSKPYQYGPKTGLGRGLVQGTARSVAGDKLETEARQEGRARLDQANLKGDSAAALAARRELVEQGGMTARTVTRMRPDQEFQYKFARLPKESQIALAREMSPAEFNRLVVLNQNAGLTKPVKAQLLKERSTGGSLPSR